MSNSNSDLASLYDILLKAHNRLHELRDETDDPELADAMLTEMKEITHRIDLVQSQLLTQASDRIAAGVATVRAGTTALESALDEISGVKDFVKACTGFLALVDRVIDLAKTIA